MKRITLIIGLMVIFASGAQAQFITIGTGSVTGVYYPLGGAICRLINMTRGDSNIRCSVESTAGSVYNINAIVSDQLPFGISQSDVQYFAYQGQPPFKQADKKLRSVFSSYSEPFTVLARADAGIVNFTDIKGKRVNIGNPGSGQRAIMEQLMTLYGWDKQDFALISQLSANEQARALCDNKVDVIIFTVGHPNGSISEATTTCDSVLIPVDNDKIAAWVEKRPYYDWATILGGLYNNNPREIRTFGAKATLVTRADVKDDTVYALVQALFDHFDQFRNMHPAFANLEPKTMVHSALTAPLHPGAERFYREKGWLSAQ